MLPTSLRLPRVWRASCALALACCVLALHAAPVHALAVIREVDPGEAPRLKDGEALLAIAVDSSTPVQEVRIKREGFALNAGKLRDSQNGRSMQLYALPAGRYRWDRVRLFGLRYRLGDDEEFAFDVRPGVINYPGDLVVRPRGWFHAVMHVANRGLQAMDWLDAHHPALSAAVPFVYTGHYGDPFPAAYRAAIAAAPPAADPRAVLPLPDPGELPIAITRLWQPARVRLLDMNPRGDLLAEVVLEEDGTWAVDMFDLRADAGSAVASSATRPAPERVLESPRPIVALDWSGNGNLLVSIGHGAERNVFVLQVRDQGDGTRTYARLQIPRLGRVIDALPGTPDAILFGSESHLGLHVHRIDIASQAALDRETFSPRRALDRGVGDDVLWFADAAGELRVAVIRGDEGLRLYHRRDGELTAGPLLHELDGFVPHALSADGAQLVGITGEDRAQDELVTVDVVTGRTVATLFRREGRDVVAPVLDEARAVVGAAYHEHGQYVVEYFDSEDASVGRRLQQAFPGRSVWMIDRNATRDRFVVSVGGSDQPDRVYRFDLAAGTATLLDDSRPWLARQRFAPSHLLRTRSKDGLDIEAYLTLPAAADRKVPLVLMPHGGPIGVRDVIAFDPEVQLLAALGYAVLQVNFRGSYGFGRAFREAGHGGLGTLIEDDIDAALQAALQAHPVDPQRMCVLGTSYGGYSALVAGVRWPGRFRCAVSIAGPSDLMLQFTASDTGRSAEGRATLEAMIGNPTTQRDAIIANSPLYNIAQLTLPVMLVHGTEDLRVDMEQSRRLQRLLALAGRPPVMAELDGEGHGIDDPAIRVAAWRAIAGFLRTHLDRPPDAAP
ncbi:alpha/beta hydrolase family protein [Chiayiivirga flava]|uniref:Dipeptidyl aminopeptidase/acylaminoacyl peptidase n=1 Tax=Chiayiivirga flava TaxID=659595 RepID=A0A7W8D3Q8_9GAMM|nr:prolyl oligopeptidase family serine peptidase [Chiayiivirga flava]MBB5207386.1 dipeptidyl aminopeptidase/acylaminoacyl peptidase [Chiayiivirga flava]